MSGWYYSKKGLLGESNVGPLSEDTMLQLCFDGEIGPKTFVVHPQRTSGQWALMESLPAGIAKHREGEQAREREKADAKRQKVEQREAQKQAAIEAASAARTASPIARYITEGQSPPMVAKIFDRARQLLTSHEEIQYIAVQAKPIAIAPDAVVLTNHRLIIFRPRMLGQLDFQDFGWLHLFNAHVSEGVMYSTLTFQVANGMRMSLDYLPKEQARMIYRICQEREVHAMEWRRQRHIEERRAASSNIVVNAPVMPQPMMHPQSLPMPAAPQPVDPVAKLKQLKEMLDGGLISAEEFNAAKAKVLGGM